MKYPLSGVAVGAVLAMAVPVPAMAQTPLSPSTPLSAPAAAQPPSTPAPSTSSTAARPGTTASHRPVRHPTRGTYAAAGDHSANMLNGRELGRLGAAPPPGYGLPPGYAYPPVAYAPPYPPPVYAPPPYAYPPPWGYYRPYRWGWRGYY